MKLLTLHLLAFGPFTDRVVHLGRGGPSLVLIHGRNEAGKSAMLRAISDLRFGIPPLSKDNFVHAHPDLRVGGVFVDRAGTEHALMRRKGRGQTLYLATRAPGHDAGLVATDVPAPPALEALLTGGLSKDEYESMFALDHPRLRAGGEALLKGEGEIGAALFEASAGVRSIPAVLERLDQSARRFFIPRGKNARINEALKAFDEQHDAYRKALVRPSQWSDLFKKHEAAQAGLARLEHERGQGQQQQLQIKELRAVAPLLRSLDQASAATAELQDAMLLAPTAATDRAAAQAGLAAARDSAALAAAEADRQRTRLQACTLDTAALAVAAAIERLSAQAESVDSLRRDLAAARVEVQSLDARVTALAAQIVADRPPADLLQRVPAPAAKAAIEEVLRQAEQAQHAVDHHRGVLDRLNTSPAEAALPDLPPPQARIALRSAQQELARSDTLLRRLAALPADIKAAQRARATALAAIGLADDAAVRTVRPLLDAEIDAATAWMAQNHTRRDDLARRMGQIGQALDAEILRRDQLLAAGAVPTAADVQAARAQRQQLWQRVRAECIDTAAPAETRASVPQAYEEAVQRADQRVDDWGRDAARAAQLQACQQASDRLVHDRELLAQQAAQLAAEALAREQAWSRRLQEAHLPAQSAGELREWQARLGVARQHIEALQRLRDEEEAAGLSAQWLAGLLQAALAGTGLAHPEPQTPLRTLAAMALDVEDEIRQREKRLNTAAGQRQEREQQRQHALLREQALAEALRLAQAAQAPAWAQLLLPGQAGIAMARARLGEFDALVAAQAQRDAAATQGLRSEQALALLAAQADAVAAALGDPPVAELRLTIDQMATRLLAARETQQQRSLAEQALAKAVASEREHDDQATRHGARLAELCAAAGVASAAQLPQAEDRSRRRREAQADLDRARSQLAQASPRAVPDLRALLEGQDAAQLDADEAACVRTLSALEEQLRTARAQEEATRRALEAVDSADTAAAARAGMEQAAAGVRTHMGPWVRSRLAHSLLTEALKRFRERAQGPMLQAASAHFEHMTAGEFVRLGSDDAGGQPVLLAQRADGTRIGAEAMSEGTRDQLYLALRLAALGLRREAGIDLPVILDDVLMTSDDARAGRMLQALATFSRGGQVLVFTHHAHLLEVARQQVAAEVLHTVGL